MKRGRSSDAYEIIITFDLVALFLSLAANVVTIWRHTRRTPPIEEHITREVEKMEGHFNDRIEKLDIRLTREVEKMRSYNSMNSRLLHEKIEAQGKDTAARLDKLTTSIFQDFRTIERTVGQLEGQINKIESGSRLKSQKSHRKQRWL